MLLYWGREKYGIWITVSSFYALIQVLDIGHQNFIGNEFIKLFHKDKENARKLIASSIIISLLVGAAEILLTLVVIISGMLPSLLGVSAETAQIERLNLSILVLVASWVLTGSVGGILVRMIIPLGLMATFIHFGSVIRALFVGILVVGAYFNLSIFWVCIFNAVVVTVYNIALLNYVKNKLPDFFPWWSGFDLKAGLKAWRKSLVLTVTTILEQLSNNGLIIAIGKFLGVASVPVFSTQRTIANASQQGLNLFVQPLQPELIKFHVNGNGEKVKNIIFLNWIFLFGTIHIVLTAMLPLIDPIYKYWTQHKLPYDAALMYLLFGSVAIAGFSKATINYLTGINHLKSLTVITVARFVTLFGGSLLLLKNMGLVSFGYGILASEIVVCVIALIFSNGQLKSLSSSITSSELGKFSLPLIVFLLGLLCHYFLDYKIAISAGSAGLQLLITAFLYKHLDKGVQLQISTFIHDKFFKHRFFFKTK